MVRSVDKGQFRVTGSWLELSPVQATVEGEGRPVRPRVIALPGPDPRELALPGPSSSRLSLLGEVAAREGPPAFAPAAGAAAFSGSEASTSPLQNLTGVSADAAEPSRTLAALLARMWLVRSAVLTNGSSRLTLPSTPGATPPPGSPSPAGKAPPAPPVPVPPSAPPTPTQTPAVPVLPQPPASPTPPEPPMTAPRARAWLHAPDEDDRHPMSGLGTFLVELALASRPPAPPPAPPAIPAAPIPAGQLHFDLHIVHCRHPEPVRPASRDSCHLWRYGREPTPLPSVYGRAASEPA